MSEIPEKAHWPGWETVKVLGRGSFGAVYEIQRKIFDETEKAALKVISIPQNENEIDEMRCDGYDEESLSDTFRERLKSIVSEYSLMRKMNGCANVVNCDDVRFVQQDNGFGWDIFIKMELLTPLNRALPQEISEETVLKIALDLCNALDLCKRYSIVHRDIKPQNIFVSVNGDYKLGDFGIARTMEKTSGGTRIGTYKYIAPEVYHNKPYGSTADIYSLGVTLYWMLNERRMAFLPLPPTKLTAGMEAEARFRRLSGEKMPEPAHGSSALKAIVMKACAFKPEDRYQSAWEMIRDLNQLMRSKEEPEWFVAQHLPQEKQSRQMAVETEMPMQQEDETLLHEHEGVMQKMDAKVLAEETAFLREQQTLLVEKAENVWQKPDSEFPPLERQKLISNVPVISNQTGFHSADEMFAALGIDRRRTEAPKQSVAEARKRGPRVHREPVNDSVSPNSGFASADEMFAALGIDRRRTEAPKQSVAEARKRGPRDHRELVNDSVSPNGGFASADEMLEYLGVKTKGSK